MVNLFLPPNKHLYMRKNQNNRLVKQYVAEHKDNARGGGSFGAYGGNNPDHAHAGKLRQNKSAIPNDADKLRKKAAEGFISSNIGKAFLAFSALILADYFLTIYAIRQHFGEFNPLTVFIFKNFQNPEIIFLLFKSAVIGLNGLLVYLMLKLKSQIKLFGKITLAYTLLAAIFAFAVAVYDIGIITGAFALPDFANGFILGFFKLFGMV